MKTLNKYQLFSIMTISTSSISGGLLLGGALLLGAFSASAVVTVPGTFNGGDIDTAPDSYFHAKCEQEGMDKHKNEYKNNPDVLVRIDGNGVLKDNDPSGTDGNFFTYTLDVKEAGDYKVLTNVSAGSGTQHFSLTISGNDLEENIVLNNSFAAIDWNTYTVVKNEGVHLEPGEYTMRLQLEKCNINIKDITFVLPMVVDPEKCNLSIPGSFLGGDLYGPESLCQQFVDGLNPETGKPALKNDYKKNPDAQVRIDGNGKIGNTTANHDYFVYYFNSKRTAEYNVIAVLEGPGNPKFKITFDGEDVISGEIPGTDNNYNKPKNVDLGNIEFSEGPHQMKFENLSGLNICGFIFEPVHTFAEMKLLVPGSFNGGDLDADDYYHANFADPDKGLKNDYKQNPDVAVRITNEGKIGNISGGDYFNYYFIVTKGGKYNVSARLQGDIVASNIKSAVTFDNNDRKEFVFAGQGWDNTVTVDLAELELEAGIHKMRFDVVNGLNIVGFDFVREATDLEPVASIPSAEIIAGDFDPEYGNFYSKNFHDGKYEDGHNRYEANATVPVKITKDGKIESSNPGDYYTYAFLCEEEGDYIVTARFNASAGARALSFVFDGDEENAILTKEFESEGWGNDYEVEATDHVTLSEGTHTVKVNHAPGGGMNLISYSFTKTIQNAVEAIEAADALVDVYSVDGVMLKNGVERENALDGLAKGLYIVGGKKVVK